MTAAKPNHLTARRLLLDHLDVHPGRTVGDDLDPLEAGVVGDTAHQEGGDSYHLGRDKIRARNGRDRYSVDESARDQRGLNDYASAMDIGYFKVKTARGTFDLYDFNAWLVALCRAGDPDTQDLREVIYSPDGKTVRRWDRLGRRASGDNSHLTHTHLSEHRDATGQRMVRLATRWLQHIGLIDEEDDMALSPDDKTWLAAQIDKAASVAAQRVWETRFNIAFSSDGKPVTPYVASMGSVLAHVPSEHTATGQTLAALAQQVAALSARQVDERTLAATLAPLLIAALPDDRDDLTPAELQQAIVGALRELAGPVA
jgi:hypothetical protein